MPGDEAFHGQPVREGLIGTAAFLDFGEEQPVGVLDLGGAAHDQFLEVILIALDFDFPIPAGRDIPEDKDGPSSAPIAAGNGGGGVLDGQAGAVQSLQEGIPGGGDEAAVQQGGPHWIFDQL